MIPGIFPTPPSRFEFVGAGTTQDQASGTISWPAGTQAGDLAFIFWMGNSTPTLSGWTFSSTLTTGSGNNGGYYYKVLTGTDISTPPTNNATSYGFWRVFVFRGPKTVTNRGNSSSIVATSQSMTGFTKGSEPGIIVAFSGDRDSSALSPVANWNNAGNGTSTYFGHCVSWIMSDQYVNSSSIVVPQSSLNTYGGIVSIVELTV